MCQCWATVGDGGPALTHNCLEFSCFLGGCLSVVRFHQTLVDSAYSHHVCVRIHKYVHSSSFEEVCRTEKYQEYIAGHQCFYLAVRKSLRPNGRTRKSFAKRKMCDRDEKPLKLLLATKMSDRT